MRHLFAIIACTALFACADERADSATSGVVRVAVLPDQVESALVARHAPLIDYLERTTSLDLELVIPASYEDLLKQFDGGTVDLAWFGGLTYVRAEHEYGAVPLAFRDVDLQFTSCYLASATDTRTAVRDFEGEDFSFGPRLSTSGHLMPRYFLEGNGQFPEQLFGTVRYSAGHDQTATWVDDGTVKLGVANCIIVQSLFDDGRLSDERVKILETTPPYADYVWASAQSMNTRTRVVLLDAFLALDATDPEHRQVLQQQGANTYLPAGRSNFSMIRAAAEEAGLLTDDHKQ